MRVITTDVPGVLVIEPKIFGDERGYFLETFHAARYAEHGITLPFVQDNRSRSKQGVLRGLHYQVQRPQGKLVWVEMGTVLDVAVDVRVGSPTFGKHVAVILDGVAKRQVYIPPGFAHGFVVLSEGADFAYKCTDFYDPELERGIAWNDPQLALPWPSPLVDLSAKDLVNPRLADVALADLPTYGVPVGERPTR